MISNCLEYNKEKSSYIINIATAFLNYFDLSHFIYIRLDGNKRMYLSTNDNWVERYINLELYNDKVHENAAIKSEKDSSRRYALWNLLPKDKVFRIANEFEMYHGFIIYNNNEIFSFATNKENQRLNSEYLNNLPLFEHFILYFKDKAHKIIENQDKRIYLPNNQKYSLKEENHEKIELLSNMEINNFYLTAKNNQEVKITKREMQILKLLSFGMTMKGAAWSLKISPKTVETHLQNIKVTLGCNCKSELIQQFQLKNLSISRIESIY